MTLTRRLACALAVSLLAVASASSAELAPQRPGVRDIYFIGFAAWGGQDVFLSEARGAAAVVAEAYDSPGRATILSNETSSGLRPATRATLRAALEETAAAMDREEDILFLLVTSHGSPKGVGLEAKGATFGALTPAALRSLLETTRVKNAIVVVSACYSGVFRRIAAPDRLVLMAARPDRPSFGCKDGNRWTYFGEALFDQALRRESDPARAFGMARDLVSRRESAEGFTPSEPQMAGGARLLRRMAAQRANGAAKSSAPNQ